MYEHFAPAFLGTERSVSITVHKTTGCLSEILVSNSSKIFMPTTVFWLACAMRLWLDSHQWKGFHYLLPATCQRP
ncbi:MAG: hypothetical protein CM15mP49_28970 [Actinomycetota bacterium]|nr:MAG: hypothetical protein CM15mP49_28970 [Actinomycetota bacterium]